MCVGVTVCVCDSVCVCVCVCVCGPAGGIEPLVNVLRLGPKSDAATHAAAALWDLASGNVANCQAIAARGHADCRHACVCE